VACARGRFRCILHGRSTSVAVVLGYIFSLSLCREHKCNTTTVQLQYKNLFSALPAGSLLLRARISYGNSVCPSVCPSRPGTDSRPGEIDSGSSPYYNVESLVSYEVMWCHWVKRFPSNEGIKEGYPLLEIVILPLLAHLAWKRLQIDTDVLRIITSTADELSGSTNIDDLERPWTPKIWVLSDFLAILGCDAHLEWIFAEIYWR